MAWPLRWLPILLASVAVAISPPARSKQQRCPRFAGKTCAGHGTCTNSTGGAVCDCEQGFLHADCSYAAYCPLDCSEHGVCRVATGQNKTLHPEDLGVCHCFNGYGGAACQEMTLLNASVEAGCTSFCSGHGRCECKRATHERHSRVRLLGGASAQGASRLTLTEKAGESIVCSCACDEGYGGAGCDVLAAPACPNSCSGRGTCGPLCGGVSCPNASGGASSPDRCQAANSSALPSRGLSPKTLRSCFAMNPRERSTP